MKDSKSDKKELFTELYDRGFDYVYSFIFARTAGDRLLTEEIVQETFACAWQSFEKFNNKSSFKTWVCSIAKNKLYQYYRKAINKKKFEAAEEIIPSEQESDYNLEKDVFENETKETVFKILNMMPPLYGYVLVMKYLDGLKVKEIAKIVGRSPKAVDGVLQRAKESFKKTYMKTEGSD